jgi:hypothetical protein
VKYGCRCTLGLTFYPSRIRAWVECQPEMTELYMCPLKGVALSETGDQMWLNDVRFENYHLFRGDVQILSGFQVIH